MKASKNALTSALLLASTLAFSQTITPPGLKSRTGHHELTPTNTRVAPDRPVITIQGLCKRPANSTATPSGCSTVVTRAEFEKLLEAVNQPYMAPPQKKTFAAKYVSALILAEKAHELGVDHGPEFDEQMHLSRVQVLARLARKRMEKDAGNVTDSEIADYFEQHRADYKMISFERIYVPKKKQISASGEKTDAANLQKQLRDSEAEMKEEADRLRARAAAGEDFTKLQQEAYDFAGSKLKAANVKQEKMRKNTVPTSDASVFDLKKGEVSEVFTDPTGYGYRIYKVLETTDLALASVHDEVARTLQGKKMRDAWDSLEKSATTMYEDRYFSTPATPASTSGTSPAAQDSGRLRTPGGK